MVIFTINVCINHKQKEFNFVMNILRLKSFLLQMYWKNILANEEIKQHRVIVRLIIMVFLKSLQVKVNTFLKNYDKYFRSQYLYK